MWAPCISDLDSTEDDLKVSARGLGIDVRNPPDYLGGLAAKREMSRLINAGKKTKFETKLQTQATARAHGAPISILTCDWVLSWRLSNARMEWSA